MVPILEIETLTYQKKLYSITKQDNKSKEILIE